MGAGAVTMTVWITNAQATGATVTARAEQTRTNHPTAGAQPLQTCAPKTAMRAIATAETGRPLVKASRRRAAFRATSTRKPTSTKKHGKLFYAGIAALAVAVIAVGAAFAYVQVLSGNLHAGLGNVGEVPG